MEGGGLSSANNAAPPPPCVPRIAVEIGCLLWTISTTARFGTCSVVWSILLLADGTITNPRRHHAIWSLVRTALVSSIIRY